MNNLLLAHLQIGASPNACLYLLKNYTSEEVIEGIDNLSAVNFQRVLKPLKN